MNIQRATTLNTKIESITVSGKLENDNFYKVLYNYLLTTLLVISISFYFIVSNDKVMHWFVLPAMLCGILMGSDVVRWLRGQLDPFDIKALVGLVTFYGMFLAPMLHAYWETYGSDLYISGDFRYWLGVVGSANAVGALGYKIAQRWSFSGTAPVRKNWQLIPQRILPLLVPVVIVAFCSQTLFYLKYLDAARMEDPIKAMQGTGWLLMLGDPLPVLLLVALVSWTKVQQKNRNYLLVSIILALATLGQFFWVGLRGSRSATVVGVFWAVALIHHFWRRLHAFHLLLGMVFLLGFMYFYSFYKGAGPRAYQDMESLEGIAQLERKTGRTIYVVLLGDLARADVQAAIASGVVEGANNYQLRYGRTYLDALSKLVPYTIWQLVLGDVSFKEEWGKGMAFLDLTLGKGKYNPNDRASHAYGLSGEAMLNFGMTGIPVAWILFGLVVGRCRRKITTLSEDDTRWTLVPLLSFTLLEVPVSDMDSLVYGLLKSGFVAFLCVLLWSRRTHIK